MNTYSLDEIDLTRVGRSYLQHRETHETWEW